MADAAAGEYGMVTGGIRAVLKVEGLALFAVAVAAYAWRGDSWWLFAILFLAPDLSFLGFLAGPRIGAYAYDALHTTIGPLALLAIGFFAETDLAIAIGLIWLAHVGLDRVLGYGLRYPGNIIVTHLGLKGLPPGM
jgi:hypothetical protein